MNNRRKCKRCQRRLRIEQKGVPDPGGTVARDLGEVAVHDVHAKTALPAPRFRADALSAEYAADGYVRTDNLHRMHRSRVYAILIDTPEAEAARAAAFWSAALGVPAQPFPPEPQFTTLHEALPGLITAVQAVNDAPRFHLDIETDDVEAETARLLALGATQISRWQECHVLRVPGGHLVCILPVESAPDVFDAQAKTWP
jgi:phosphoribosylformylglycinamidine (FGAM) synthase PurS component